MIEYLMLAGVNDSVKQAQTLAALFRGKPLFMVNLVPYNATGNFKSSAPAAIIKFRVVLENAGIEVTQRVSLGQDIQAACGQLAGGNH